MICISLSSYYYKYGRPSLIKGRTIQLFLFFTWYCFCNQKLQKSRDPSHVLDSVRGDYICLRGKVSNLGLVLMMKQIIGRGYVFGGGGESVFLAFFGCPSCDLDAISIGGMEFFCYLEFCLNFMFWSRHLVPMDPSGDCIRV